MEKPLDLRIQKTQTALINAFLQLLQTKRFENITINELCELAMVRRATFYKHFADKYEFFTFFVQRIQREFRNRIVPQEYDRNGVSPYIDIIRFALDFLDENETIVHSVMESNAFPLLLDLISEQIILDVKEQLQTDQNNGTELLLPPELMAFSYTGALLNILRWWIGHKNQMSKEEIIAQIQKVFDKLYAA